MAPKKKTVKSKESKKEERVRKREEKKRNKDKEEGHVILRGNGASSVRDYSIIDIIADGTFGRVYKVRKEGQPYAMKVIRPIDRYIESAKVEIEILKELQTCPNVVRIEESFFEKSIRTTSMVFAIHGPSLYQIEKDNSYRGFHIWNI